MNQASAMLYLQQFSRSCPLILRWHSSGKCFLIFSHNSKLIRVLLRELYRAQDETRRRQKGQHKLAFSTVSWKQALQSVWLHGSVTGSTKISMQILQWQSDKESGISDSFGIFSPGRKMILLIHHQHLQKYVAHYLFKIDKKAALKLCPLDHFSHNLWMLSDT